MLHTKDFERLGAEKMLEELKEKYELIYGITEIDTRIAPELNGLCLIYCGQTLGIFESKIRKESDRYMMDTTFHPFENAHLIVSKINLEKEEHAERVKMYSGMMRAGRDETAKQKRDRINRFRCGQ